MPQTFIVDAANSVITIDGRVMTDYGNGDFIAWEKDEENFTASTSANGTVGVAVSHDQLGTVTYKPMQGSQEIKFLNNLANTRKTFPIYINSGGEFPEIVSGTRCQVKRSAGGSISNEVSDREFEIAVFDYLNE